MRGVELDWGSYVPNIGFSEQDHNNDVVFSDIWMCGRRRDLLGLALFRSPSAIVLDLEYNENNNEYNNTTSRGNDGRQ